MLKKINNLTLISMTILIIFLVILVTSIAKINENHNEKLLYSMQTKVEYYAKRCYLESNCEGTITLKDLYERDYLKTMVNPVTKEVLDENTSMIFFDNEIIVNWQ